MLDLLLRIEPWLPLILGLGFIYIDLPSFGKKRAEANKQDRGSYWIITGLIGGGFFLAFQLAYWPQFAAFDVGRWASVVGVVLFVLGGVLRRWAMRTLGRYFTRTVQTSSDQPVIEIGPYRLIRHPSYTGAMVAELGVILTSRNLLSVAVVVVTTAVAIAYRIRVEEAALAKELGEPYRAYMSRTKRLVPFLY